ncbi:hypothetical protein WICPIJ_009411 [Wickerhamomyces pijperi]|uniref:Uncharacterized protein n=1 Tax=Wickerhamomyces pijperi TaxID=599730 RepID=A0A9P8PMX0_WICPI|nr:hypothetical protein WICPIJ_009411 [Wickerhamomyces pijperi]
MFQRQLGQQLEQLVYLEKRMNFVEWRKMYQRQVDHIVTQVFVDHMLVVGHKLVVGRKPVVERIELFHFDNLVELFDHRRQHRWLVVCIEATQFDLERQGLLCLYRNDV